MEATSSQKLHAVVLEQIHDEDGLPISSIIAPELFLHKKVFEGRSKSKLKTKL